MQEEKQEERKLTFKEKMGILAAICMFFAIGMMMGGGKAGNLPLQYSGATLFTFGAGIAIWLLISAPSKDDEEFEE
jgi:hypothetical protein